MEGTHCDGFVSRWRWAILLAWLLAAGLMIGLVPQADPTLFEVVNFLPPQAPYSQALDAFQKAFPKSSALSEVVVIFERPGGALTPADLSAIGDVAAAIPKLQPNDKSDLLKGVTILTPADIPLQPNPLISPESPGGQAALIRMNATASKEHSAMLATPFGSNGRWFRRPSADLSVAGCQVAGRNCFLDFRPENGYSMHATENGRVDAWWV